MNSPKEIAQNYIAAGVSKATLPAHKKLLLGILAGMFIALAGVGASIAPVTVASASLGKLIGAAVFPVGLAMVLLAGSELFTGNCLMIIPVMEKSVKLRAMFSNWVYVYIGNFIGGILIAALAVYGGTFDLFSDAAGAAVIRTAVGKVGMTFSDAMLRGILCNFIVCIAVWISFAAKDVVGKVAGIFLPIMLFVLSGYEHSIANMFYIPAGIFASGNTAYAAAYENASGLIPASLNWGGMLVRNLLPVTIGNIIGGTFLVGLPYWLIYLRDPSKNTAKSKPGAKGRKRR